MFSRVAFATTLAVSAGAATTLKLTWSDCGDASTHAKVTSLSTDHIVTGAPSPVTGTGTVDEDVAGGSYAIDLVDGIVKEHWTGNICEPQTFKLPLAAGSVKWLGMKCPQSKGVATVGTEIDLSALLPSMLTHAKIKITATDTANNKLLCLNIATAPETELVEEAAAYFKHVNISDSLDVLRSTSQDNCAKPGDCGIGYQACCAAYGKKGFPCGCHLKDGEGDAGSSCGVCGVAYTACCMGFKAKGFPCTCDVEPSSIVV